MHDANDLVRAMQQVSSDAVQAGGPADVMTGTVVSAQPLKIQVEQRFEISGGMIILPERMTDHEVKITLEKELTEPAGEPEHEHEYGGELTIKVCSGLKKGDKVILIRQSGGQKFLVADRVV